VSRIRKRSLLGITSVAIAFLVGYSMLSGPPSDALLEREVPQHERDVDQIVAMAQQDAHVVRIDPTFYIPRYRLCLAASECGPDTGTLGQIPQLVSPCRPTSRNRKKYRWYGLLSRLFLRIRHCWYRKGIRILRDNASAIHVCFQSVQKRLVHISGRELTSLG